jgi:leader peptidase (prepilin peptidase)/N-methyltransferase
MPLLYAGGALAGAVVGAIGTRLADTLPARYGITHLVTGAARTKRNIVVVVLLAACGAALVQRILSHPEISTSTAAWYFATSIVMLGAVIAGSAIDLEHMILPDEITIGGAVLAGAVSHFGIGIVSSLAGAGIGLAATYLPHLLYRVLKKRSAQGVGDVKVVVMAGAWLGPLGALLVLFAGALQAAIAAVVMRVLRIEYRVPASVRAEIEEARAKAAEGDEEAKEFLAGDVMALDVSAGVMTTRLPLGPFFALACVELVFAKGTITSLVLGFLSD